MALNNDNIIFKFHDNYFILYFLIFISFVFIYKY